MTRTVKEPGANKALREAIKRIEARLGALETDTERRLQKLEVVKPLEPYRSEPDPQEPQRPETE